jgi:hypothetical protein
LSIKSHEKPHAKPQLLEISRGIGIIRASMPESLHDLSNFKAMYVVSNVARQRISITPIPLGQEEKTDAPHMVQAYRQLYLDTEKED